MSSLRSLLLLVIVGGLALFVLQNWSPVLPLVLLGVPTQAIPLAFWMVGAIAIGAITTIAIAALFRITAFTVAPRKRRPKGRSSVPPTPPTSGRSIDPMDVPYGVANSPRTTIQSDDWEPQPREAWDDWETPAARDREASQYRSIDDRPPADFQGRDRQEEYRQEDFRAEDFRQEARQSEPPEEPFYPEASDSQTFGNDEPPIYDAPYEVYRPPYRSLDEPYEQPYEQAYSQPDYSEPEYAEPEYREPEYREPEYREPDYSEPTYTEPELEVWDDWEEREDEPPIAPPEPQRPIVEVQQTPKSQYRSGTVYSYSYRGEDDPPKSDRTSDSAADQESERVIIPPAPVDDDEDWEFDDDEDDTNTGRRSNSDRDW